MIWVAPDPVAPHVPKALLTPLSTRLTAVFVPEDRVKVAPLFMVSLPLTPSVLGEFIVIPPDIVTSPVILRLLFKVRIPALALINEPLLVMTPPYVNVMPEATSIVPPLTPKVMPRLALRAKLLVVIASVPPLRVS